MKYHEMLCSPFWTNPNFVQCCCPTMSSSQMMHPKSRKSPSPSLAELIKTPGMQVALRLAEWNPNRCPIHCAQSFPVSAFEVGTIQIGPDNPTFNSSQLSTGSTQLAKYSKFLLAYRFETCSPSEPPNPELCSALHRMPPL